MSKSRFKRLKITTEPYKPTTMDILDSLASAEQKNPHEILKNYAQTYFHKHSLYGILQKPKNPPPGLGSQPNEFKLFLYKKAIRNDYTAHQMDTSLTVDVKDEVLNVSGKDLKKLTLLKLNTPGGEQTAINFDQSVRDKKIIPSVGRNPYFHDHFIYISIMNTRKAQACYNGFKKHLAKIKAQFQKTASYTDDFILLNESKSLIAKLEEKLAHDKIKEKLKKGKIYFIVQGHCSAGSDTMSGENPDGSHWTLTLDQLVAIIKKFEIPKCSHLDIDIFACEPGQFEDAEPAFCQRLKDKIHDDFSNLSVRGNLHVTYSDPEVILAESPREVSVFGKLREPLSSKEQLMHSEIYYRIAHFPTRVDKKSGRDDLILAFKKFAKELIADDKKMSYDAMHALLKNKWNNFKKLDNTIQKAKIGFAQFMTDHKINHPKAYAQLQASFLKEIDNSYHRAALDLRFRQAWRDFIKIKKEFDTKLTRINKIYELKKQLSSNPQKCLLFKGKMNWQVLSIIAQAEKEQISFDEAFKRIFCSFAEKQKLSPSGKVPKLQIS